LRKDALCAASEFVLAVESAARTEPGLIATVGKATVEPGVANIIPGLAEVTFDIRHQNDETKAAAVRGLEERARTICEQRGAELEWSTLQEHPAVAFSPRLLVFLEQAVETTCGRAHLMPSGAGHDTVSVAHLTDVSMLFVRCKGGVSHHPDESVEGEDVAAVIDTMNGFLQLLADHEGDGEAGSGIRAQAGGDA
jgi:allantoate deiminase